MTIRLFSSKDSGAPQLGAVSGGDLITVLRACLVDGYGTRTSAGWTMPFDDLANDIACFQTVGGNDLLRVENPDYRYAYINGYESMTGHSTGLEPYPDNVADLGVNMWRTGVRISSADAYDNWYVIADDEWFYFHVPHDTTSSNDPTGFFFGQYDCIEPTFTPNYCITGFSATATTTATNSVENGLFTEANMWCRRDYRNQAGFRVDARRDFESTNYQYPSRLTGSIHFEAVKIRSNDITPYDYYGTFPAFFRAMLSQDFDLNSDSEKITIGGVTYIQFVQISHVIAIKYDVDVG